MHLYCLYIANRDIRSRVVTAIASHSIDLRFSRIDTHMNSILNARLVQGNVCSC